MIITCPECKARVGVSRSGCLHSHTLPIGDVVVAEPDGRTNTIRAALRCRFSGAVVEAARGTIRDAVSVSARALPDELRPTAPPRAKEVAYHIAAAPCGTVFTHKSLRDAIGGKQSTISHALRQCIDEGLAEVATEHGRIVGFRATETLRDAFYGPATSESTPTPPPAPEPPIASPTPAPSLPPVTFAIKPPVTDDWLAWCGRRDELSPNPATWPPKDAPVAVKPDGYVSPEALRAMLTTTKPKDPPTPKRAQTTPEELARMLGKPAPESPNEPEDDGNADPGPAR